MQSSIINSNSLAALSLDLQLIALTKCLSRGKHYVLSICFIKTAIQKGIKHSITGKLSLSYFLHFIIEKLEVF
jgi:hypothetical protein